jgi:parvulin-like peptidyl-prolyl isomerase
VLLAGIVLGVVLSGEMSRADLIDRMMAVVDGRVVTLGDVRHHEEVAGLFGDPVGDDESDLLQEVIEDLLIRDQIDQFPGLQVEEERVDETIAQLPDTDALTTEATRDAVRDRLVRINYFDLRFRRFTEATDEEIVSYYETVFLPEALARGLEPLPALDEVSDLIGENVITEKADREISVWTESLIARSDIEVVE